MEKTKYAIAGKPRESGLELYRVIVMIMIVAHHYVVNSGLNEKIYHDMLAPQSIFLLLFGAWGKTGINCFVLITGYFMCKSSISLKKLAKLLLEITLYHVVFYFIFAVAGYQKFSFAGLVSAVIPIQSLKSNFTPCYIVFFMFIPFLNILVRSMNQRQHALLVALCLGVYTVLGSIPGFTISMNYVTWFCILYFVASFIRLYPSKLFENNKLWGAATAVCVMLGALSVIVMAWYGHETGKTTLRYFFLADSNKILAVATGISSFIFFKNLKLKYSPFINALGASTFGVLQIHANSEIMRTWLWKDFLQNTKMYDSPWLVLHAVGSILAIFAVCTLIDHLRIRFLEKPFFEGWDRYYSRCENRVRRMASKLTEIIRVEERNR